MDYLFSGTILHLTRITSALSESCRDLTERLITKANKSSRVKCTPGQNHKVFRQPSLYRGLYSSDKHVRTIARKL